MDQRILQIIQKHPELKSEFEEIYPELKGSENEKIKKDIIQFFKDAANSKTMVICSNTFAKWAEYLEKQKEPRHAIRVTKGFGDLDGPQFELVDLKKDQKLFSQEVFDAAKHEALWGEQKSAWSEEDKKLLDFWSDVIDRNDWKMDENFCKASREFINRLKSLRPSWKPSEYQMAMLRAVLNDNDNMTSEAANLALESLYNDLNKLK